MIPILTYNQQGISVLNKLKISTKEVISYLESVNEANDQILKVLQKKPSLPGYRYLPWVVEFKMDKGITNKLKSNEALNNREKIRLRNMLMDALQMLKKGHSQTSTDIRLVGLKKYIKQLEID